MLTVAILIEHKESRDVRHVEALSRHQLAQFAACPNFPRREGTKPTLISVDLGAGEQHAEAYRAINPRLVVPALVLEDGTTIAEVPAIMRYLDEAFPETPLLGATSKDKGLVVMWERFAEKALPR